ncbi:MAG: cbb3-type cytochrome c oxidase subunit 3 [Ignavibacteriaceae bacterium]|nr:cbb3-type cytochrome c oxidase subunit 3 [Ignavibacteriaceae bacterium]
MIRDLLQSIEGVEIYPLISLIVFVVFFVVILVWMLRIDKNYIKEMGQLPLDSNSNRNLNSTGETDVQ